MAPKSKKPPPVIKPEFVLEEKKGSQPQKKRKKNAPDRPQPEWMFPPDEENPILNPKPKSEARRIKDENDRDQAIKFLQYKSVTAPLKAAPPDLLLTLVGAFLSSYGFNSTSRIYTTQLQSRKKLDEWKLQLDAKLPKGFPDLVKIYKEWYKVYQERTNMDETSSSSSEGGSEESEDTKTAKKSKKSKKQAKASAKASEEAAARVNAKDETSSSGGSDSELDVEITDTMPTLKAAKKNAKASKAKSPSSSTTSSSADSDADDEKEPAGAPLHASAASQTSATNGPVKNLKRKAASSDSTSSGSDSSDSTDSGSKAIPAAVAGSSPSKKAKTKTAALRGGDVGIPLIVAKPSSSSNTTSTDESTDESPKKTVASTAVASTSSSSSGTSSSDSESEELDFSQAPKRTPTVVQTTSPSKVTKKLNKTPSDSSETLQATSTQKPSTANTSLTTSTSTSSSDSAVPAENTKRKRTASPVTPTLSKHQKKQNTPFQRVPKDTPVDPRMSNTYKPYDYADRAHQDLSVTKGKGFTKEKNKKKRGSYRGGAIDVSGGKGIKFED